MALAGGYYIETLWRKRGVMQGYLILTPIFNVVVDAVVHH